MTTNSATSNQTGEQVGIKVDVSKAVVKGQFNLELTKQFENYQNLLADASAVVFTRDNMDSAGGVLKTVRSVIAAIDKIRERVKKPYLDAGKNIDEAAKELMAPLKAVLEDKANQYRKLADDINAEKESARKENERVSGIRQAINEFILQASQAIAGARTAEEIVAVEKLIGSHKVNKSRYEEFLPELAQRTNELVPLIREQKKAIRELEELENKKKEAEKRGDDQTIIDIMEKQQLVEGRIEEGKVVVQETAVTQAVENVTVPEIVVPKGVSARRTTWKAELVDAKEAFKKCPELLDVTLNSGKVSDSIKTLKGAGVFSGKTEVIISGIRYFEEKLY